MAEIGDKSFTTDMIQLIKDAVKAELGTNAYVNRYLAEITAVNTTTSEVSVKLSGSDTASDSFRVRGIHLPEVGQQVVACIDGQDRWIESVIRPTTSTPYLTFSTASGVPTGSMVPYVGATAPTGWLLCDGTLVSRTTYAALFAIIGTKAGVGDGSTTFALPDMKDRFLGGNLLTATQYAQNTSGTLITPVTAIAAPAHTHQIGAHTHGYTNTHSHTGAGHTHDVAGSSATYTMATTTRNTGVYTTTYDVSHAHTSGTYASSTPTSVGTTGSSTPGTSDSQTSYASDAASATAIGTPKTGLVNFIIKT